MYARLVSNISLEKEEESPTVRLKKLGPLTQWMMWLKGRVANRSCRAKYLIKPHLAFIMADGLQPPIFINDYLLQILRLNARKNL